MLWAGLDVRRPYAEILSVLIPTNRVAEDTEVALGTLPRPVHRLVKRGV